MRTVALILGTDCDGVPNLGEESRARAATAAQLLHSGRVVTIYITTNRRVGDTALADLLRQKLIREHRVPSGSINVYPHAASASGEVDRFVRSVLVYQPAAEAVVIARRRQAATVKLLFANYRRRVTLVCTDGDSNRLRELITQLPTVLASTYRRLSPSR